MALKVIKGAAPAGGGLRRRFLREARAMAAVAHDNVVPIHEVGEQDGVPYLVMPLLRGQVLSARLLAGPLPPAEAARVVGQVAAGLAAVHARGLVHRDVKPGNIWLERSAGGDVRAKVMDFGLATGADDTGGSAGPLTAPGAFLGTLPYMAPEQAADPSRADARSDLYSLGCVLYEALTGERAAARPDGWAVGPATPRPLVDLVARLLSPDPADRPAPAAAVADRLAAVAAAAPRPRRLRWWVAGGLVGAAVAAAGIVWATRRPDPPPVVPPAGDPARPAPAPPGSAPAEAHPDPDRAAAEWAFGLGACEVSVEHGGKAWKGIPNRAALPTGRFVLVGVDFRKSQVLRDADLARLPAFGATGLDSVNLEKTAVTDAGVEHLTGLSLVDLVLSDLPGVTDATAERLGRMTSLSHLRLDGTRVTDVGLKHLARLENLQELSLDGVRGVSADGLRQLRKALPRCDVTHDR